MPNVKSIWSVFLILLAIFMGLRIGNKLLDSMSKSTTAA